MTDLTRSLAWYRSVVPDHQQVEADSMEAAGMPAEAVNAWRSMQLVRHVAWYLCPDGLKPMLEQWSGDDGITWCEARQIHSMNRFAWLTRMGELGMEMTVEQVDPDGAHYWVMDLAIYAQPPGLPRVRITNLPKELT